MGMMRFLMGASTPQDLGVHLLLLLVVHDLHIVYLYALGVAIGCFRDAVNNNELCYIRG